MLTTWTPAHMPEKEEIKERRNASTKSMSVSTLPVSNRQGIFLPIFRTKILQDNKKPATIRTISS